MADVSAIEAIVTPATKAAFTKLQWQHGLSESQIAAALLDWFAAKDTREQKRILQASLTEGDRSDGTSLRPFAIEPQAHSPAQNSDRFTPPQSA